MSYFQLGDEGATTASEEVEAEPHFYFQLRSGGATSEGAEANQTILMLEAHLPSPSGPLPQPEREWVQGVEEEGMRMGSQEGPVVPASLGETTTFHAFIKENIEVSITLIGEHDQHDKIGEAPQQLTWEKEFLVNFFMEIPKQRIRSSYGSLPLKGARKSSSGISLEIRKNQRKMQSMLKGTMAYKGKILILSPPGHIGGKAEGKVIGKTCSHCKREGRSLEAGEITLPKEDIHIKEMCPPSLRISTILKERKKEGNELVKQDEAIKGATQPEKTKELQKPKYEASLAPDQLLPLDQPCLAQFSLLEQSYKLSEAAFERDGRYQLAKKCLIPQDLRSHLHSR
ncbi:hypothetical protein Tco_1300418 [Tanacetum coccineum]